MNSLNCCHGIGKNLCLAAALFLYLDVLKASEHVPISTIAYKKKHYSFQQYRKAEGEEKGKEERDRETEKWMREGRERRRWKRQKQRYRVRNRER